MIETWPRTAQDADHPEACTYAELLGHLRDLIDLARVEGFGRVVGVLERADRELRRGAGRVRQRRAKRRRPSLW